MNLDLKHGALHLHSYNGVGDVPAIDIIDAANATNRISLTGYRITQVTIEAVGESPIATQYPPVYPVGSIGPSALPSFPFVHFKERASTAPAAGNLPEAMAPELDPKDLPSSPVEKKPRRPHKSQFDGQYIAITRQGRDNPRGRHKASVGRTLLDAVRSAGTMSWEAYRDLAPPGDAGRNLRHDIHFGNVRMIKQEKK